MPPARKRRRVSAARQDSRSRTRGSWAKHATQEVDTPGHDASELVETPHHSSRDEDDEEHEQQVHEEVAAIAKPHLDRFARRASELLEQKASQVRNAMQPPGGISLQEACQRASSALEAEELRGKRLEELRDLVNKLHRQLRALSQSQAPQGLQKLPTREIGLGVGHHQRQLTNAATLGFGPSTAAPLRQQQQQKPSALAGLLRKTNRPRLLA
mmetsp:Transcript_33554/g.50732  ORF Transcript_33554/g.50732 Transcript_33554/m.50732 type:complete len:213 (-) Transcript_33554:457-1095(-)|eukprot:CAMPEP_0194749654 /NCGR_PEP_ID=MMETSP0323_2-20130528/3781_1 /TAXON_ID=2866 ORGANISM="Crypthecodinium cohnii, Strain Seligo" /NCGR_SAMPLE_ID=MMETSP0323_2 /ASSEMBLY_ACC=CAM_ASM_000346 /LENGTH=212 /DNA_ID=CAMNT_0039664845 /DNA_START=84 /DNA_END=722 /DNA_ORIENTATION=-